MTDKEPIFTPLIRHTREGVSADLKMLRSLVRAENIDRVIDELRVVEHQTIAERVELERIRSSGIVQLVLPIGLDATLEPVVENTI